MKKNVKYEQITKEIVTYEANDGTIFWDEKECEKYEATAECAINSMVDSISIKKLVYGEDIFFESVPFSCEGRVRAIEIRNANDVEIINKWIAFNYDNDPEKVKQHSVGIESIGETIVFEAYDGDIWELGTIDKLVEKYRKVLIKYLIGENENGEEKQNV